MDLVSVLMCTYHEPINYIIDAVESIISQTYHNIEFVIVVDGPDRDDIISYLDYASTKDKRIFMHINKSNMGLVKSLNKGIKLCNGKYVARMDADDISEPNRIEDELNFLQSNNFDLVSSNFILFFDDSQNTIKYKYPEFNDKCKKMLRYANCVPHPAWLIKKSLYEEMHGYRDIDACEDYDLVLRATLKGYKIGNCQKYLLKYRYDVNGISRIKVGRQKAITYFLSKNFRMGRIVTIDNYKNFVGSKEYNSVVNSITRLEDNKCKYKFATKKSQRLLYLIKVVWNPYFWIDKMINLKIREKVNEK